MENNEENKPQEKPVSIVVEEPKPETTETTKPAQDASKDTKKPVESESTQPKQQPVEEPKPVPEAEKETENALEPKPEVKKEAAEDLHKVDVATEPVTREVESEVKQPPAVEGQATVTESVAEVVAPATMGVAASQMGKEKHSHRNNKKLAVIVTISVAILLSAIAVYVYLSTDNNTESTQNSANASAQLSEENIPTGPATADDVTQITAEVEEALDSLDEEADFSQFELSNTNLGL